MSGFDKKVVAELFDGKIRIKKQGMFSKDYYTAYVVYDNKEYYLGQTMILHKFGNCFETWVLSLKNKRINKLAESVKHHKEEYERLNAQYEVFKQL